GPEWRRAPGSAWQPARAPCEAVDERQAVTCAVEVVRATGAARLVVAYATVAQAEREWPRDAAATVDAFCGVAQRRGALASAEVVVRAAGRERRFGCDAAASEAARSPSRDQRGEQE
ncbi:MAG: hypothetical protein KC560_07315, partial [Myxococcales bacterium]|nr:hypothetical protein [Myxococcales bacterium]